MSQPTSNSAIPSSVTRKMQLVRQRKLWVQVASAVVAAVAVLLAAMGISMLIDWLATLYDAPLRSVLTTTAIATALVTLGGWLVIAWKRGLRWERVAHDVDSQLPQLEERWTTMTRLGPHAADPQVVHPAMLRRVATEAAGWDPHVDPQQVVSLSGLGRAMMGLSAIAAVLVVAVMLDSHRMMVLIQRFWQPTASISATELVNTPGNVVVGRGESLDLTAAIKGTPVERAMLFIQSPESHEQMITLVAHGEKPIEFSHHLRSVDDPFKFRFRAGDGQTPWATVDVTDRPEIEALLLTVTPPAYTGQAKSSFDKLPRRVTAMEKSELQFAIRPTVPVKSLQLRLDSSQIVDMTAGEDGWYRWTTTLTDSFAMTPVLTEPHGLTNRRTAKVQINVTPDRAPVVKVISPDNQVAVRPDDKVQIKFAAQDDVGIASAFIDLYDETDPENAVPLTSIEIPLGDQAGARRIEGSYELDMSQYEVTTGSQLGFEVRVVESRDAALNSAAQQMQQASSGREGRSNSQARMASASPRNGNQATPSSPSDPASKDAQRPQTGAPNATAESTPAKPGETVAANNPANPTNPASNNATTTDPTAMNNQPASNQTPANSVAQTSTNPSANPSTNPSNNSAANPTANSSPNNPANSTASAQDPSKATDPAASTPTNPSESKPSATSVASNPPGQSGSPANSNSPDSKNSTTSASNNNSPNNASSNPGTPGNSSSNNGDGKVATNDSKTETKDEARTVTSNRQSITPMNGQNGGDPNANQTPNNSLANNTPGGGANGQNQMANNQSGGNPSNGNPSNGNPSNNNNNNNNNNSGSPPANSTANQQQQQQSSDGGSSPPPNNMTMRSIDVQPAQAASSQRMRLQVDEYAGSFEGQSRKKLEIAIAPELAKLDEALARAEKTSSGVLEELKVDSQWRGKHDRDMTNAEHSTVDAQQVIRSLTQKTHNTPYAFIGLQLVDIGVAHVNPARNNFWTSLQSEGEARVTNVRDGWQHVTRARQLLAELNGQFQRAQREFELAEKLEQVKKMYQVFLEDSFGQLGGGGGDPNRFNRKMAEFDFDEEFLKGYREFLEKRRDLMAEIAKILAEDPRLLQRYMDRLRGRSQNLREQLANLVGEQQDLNREVKAWTLVGDDDRARIAQVLLQRQLNDAANLATDAGNVQDRYQTWLPLSRQTKDPDLQGTTKLIQETATSAQDVATKAGAIIAEMQRVKLKQPADAKGAAPEFDTNKALNEMRESADTLVRRISDLEVSLRQMSSREDDQEIAIFAGNRLAEVRKLNADAATWIREIDEHRAGNYPRAAEIAQNRLAEGTDRIAGKLGGIEQELAQILARPDGKLPENIAEKARAFFKLLDEKAQPNQLASVYALRQSELPRATERQAAAHEALAQAEKTFDEMVRMTLAEADKNNGNRPDLPPDPTLEQLLNDLEDESFLLGEALGIPRLRPINFLPQMDMMRPGQGLGGGAGRAMLANQMRQRANRLNRQLDRSYKEAIARALKESTERTPIQMPQPTISVNWNKVVSQLGENLEQGREKAPPEQYRRAIEQYLYDISKAAAEMQEPPQ